MDERFILIAVWYNMAEALEQLPANSIERIEVITNPSARFKPDGTSGIINIVLKKNKKKLKKIGLQTLHKSPHYVFLPANVLNNNPRRKHFVHFL